MRLESPDVVAQNVDRLGALFPTCVTETAGPDGKLRKSVNFDALRRLLDRAAVDDSREAYEFTWVGKKAALREANAPIRKTLRPCPEESKNWETTENLYIEGDNLDVLKLLQANYLGKVKMIYIDPPYNTGNDFIYRDDFSHSQEEEDALQGRLDEDDNRLFKNTETNSRFHSDWCSMIYSRLILARNLLRDDGVIFISIDDNEQENLKKCCDEVFGGRNFIAQLVWQRAFSPKNDARFISNSHDYVMMYAKNIYNFTIGRLPRTEQANARYSNPDNDPRGLWISDNISVKTYNEACDYPITTPAGRVIEPPAGRCWSLSPNAFLERLQDNRIWFGSDGNGVPRLKRFLSDLKHDGMAPTSILFHKDVGHSQEGSQELSKLMDGGVFNGPKPKRLIERLLTLANLEQDSIVLDFFSGSATLAHSLMSYNATKQTHTRFILVQIPELCAEKTEAYKAGYKTICEIGKERIRRAGEKIKSENPLTTQDLDVGFRVLKVDDSNMKNVYYHPDDLSQQNLLDSVENIKEDRSDLDLLFGCVLDWGLELSRPYTSEKVGSYTIHNYDDGKLVACFDENVSEELVRMIAKTRPERVVFRDSSFKSAPEKINLFEIFKFYMPESADEINRRVRVL